jgi:hypothetical protein
MTISAFASGTQTAILSTEHFLANVNVEGKFTGIVDVSNLADGDILELRAYQMVLTGGTPRVVDYLVLYGAQPTEQQIIEWGKELKNELTDAQSLRYSLKQTAGVGRSFPWKVVRETVSGGGGGLTAQDVWEYATRSLTEVANANLVEINGQATDGYNATLKLKQLDIENNDAAGNALRLYASDGNAVQIYGETFGARIQGGTGSIHAPDGFLVTEDLDLNPWSIADAVWDEEVATGHTLPDTAGAVLYSGYVASVSLRVQKNTALNNFMFFMRQEADHVSPATGLSVTAQRSIDGGLFAACANAVSEVGDGVYKINLAAADLNGNVITLKFTAAGADQRTVTIITQD